MCLCCPLEMLSVTGYVDVALRTNVSTPLRLGKLSAWARKKVVADVGRLQEMEGRPFYIMANVVFYDRIFSVAA